MKLKSYIFSILAVALLSCSTDDVDDVIKKEEPLVFNATLSLAIKSDVKSKAINADYNKIQKLSLAIFVKDKLLSYTEVTEDVTGIKNIPVVAGEVKLILFANYFDDEKLNEIKEVGTDISKYKELEVSLDGEKNVNQSDNSGSGLTMSSEILQYSLKAGHNYIGIETETDGYVVTKEPVKLNRNVSKVQLETIFLHPSDNYKGKGDVTFKLTDFCVANVKSRSMLIPDNGTTEVLSNESSFWFCGTYADIEGSLKQGRATECSYLYYDVINPPKGSNKDDYSVMNIRYPFLNNDLWVCSGNIFGLDVDNQSIKEIKAEYQYGVDYSDTEYPKIGIAYGAFIPLGTYFYVYENMSKGETNRTLLIIKGDYTYEPTKKGEKVVMKDRYYAVTINKEGESDYLNNTLEHVYVKRNNVYNVLLTIKGPGSDTPFGVQDPAHISAFVKVKNWDVVNQEEEVD
ncbi:fimbrial protein [Parabacteroides sp. GYB001]|uniref:fimbrial protein n=1 Tax=Parabacteroides leei TaxID=2939491 RepID=UPI0020180A63|nr:fimbrial protein [Parabacteroides leei]MCL3850514.1 fimbrial protein [Parabacteroides leei]